jgi:hypothetical protein
MLILPHKITMAQAIRVLTIRAAFILVSASVINIPAGAAGVQNKTGVVADMGAAPFNLVSLLRAAALILLEWLSWNWEKTPLGNSGNILR